VDGARPDESTPVFAEMAVPGAAFEGVWDEKNFFLQPEVRRALRWPESLDRAKIFEAANVYAAGLLALQRQYASMAGMGLLDKSLEELEQRLAQARQNGACLIALGWGGGLLAKSSWPIPPTRITARSCSSTRCTTARSRPICTSPKRGKSCS
jgi:hypothetical protein